MSSSGASDELSELLRAAGDNMIIAYRNKNIASHMVSSLLKARRLFGLTGSRSHKLIGPQCIARERRARYYMVTGMTG
ncbi:hypothetical protein M422DRAFT_245891 [Sphaerobolus stellatus SS14]|nr:hypothetical protein M422DRAFT_245891 [Sphaerobolus stellatus SS14]